MADRIAELASQLAKVHKRKEGLREELKRLDHEEKTLALQLNSAMGLVPVDEAAKMVQGQIDRMKKVASRQRSAMMKRLWDSKSPEEKAEWKRKMLERRKEKSVVSKAAEITGGGAQ